LSFVSGNFGGKKRAGKFFNSAHPHRHAHPHPRGGLIYEDDDEDEEDYRLPGKQ
jgi:hypothetical protein